MSFSQFFNTSTLNLHQNIYVSGDFWIGSSIFAAKHLQPDYVKSIPIPSGKNGTYFDVEQYLDDIEDDETKNQLLQEIYDTNRFPTSFLELME